MTLDTPPTNFPKPWRETPLIYSPILSKHAGCQIYLKLETLQPSGSFKSRGIGNLLLSHLTSSSTAPNQNIHFYSSSGGNAGLACVHASTTLNTPCTILVPLSTSASIISKLHAAGASSVLQHGASWVEADTHLRTVVIPAARERGENAIYVPPFDDPKIWEGHATLVDEIAAQLPPQETNHGATTTNTGPSAIICSVGGGGLFCGIAQGLASQPTWQNPDLNPNYTPTPNSIRTPHILAVETHGAHSLALSLQHATLSTLPSITSAASTLGARTVAPRAFELAQADNVTSVVLSDREAMEGCVRFAEDERIMVELACGVSVALCYGGRLKRVAPWLGEESRVVVVVCGGVGVGVDLLGEWKRVVES